MSRNPNHGNATTRQPATSKTHILLGRLFEARSKEYSAGLSALPADVRERLVSVLQEVLRELP
jgi:hypothetical protein